MNSSNNKTINTAAFLIIVAILLLFLFLAQNILFPIILAFIFAIILLPLVKFLSKKIYLPNVFSVFLAIALVLGSITLIFFMLSKQISSIFEDIPEIKKNLNVHFNNIQTWINTQFHITNSEQVNFIEKTVSSNNLISPNSMNSIGNIAGIFVNALLIPIYTFLILIYRSNFVQFFNLLVSHSLKTAKNNMHEILHEINVVIRNYIIGLLIEMIIVGFLTGFGLWIIGIKYFVFLGILTAFLNLIPYIGILIASATSILLTLVGTTDLSLIIGVLVVNAVVQFIDNNILIPKVVGSKVSINALASMVGVIVGGTLAGVGGMFLALPILAILKVIFDRFENLKAYGFLIGETNTSQKKDKNSKQESLKNN